MKGKRVVSAVQKAKAAGNQLPEIPHPALSDQIRLNPTDFRYKKAKSSPGKSPSALICVYLPRRSPTKTGLNSVSPFSLAIVINRAHAGTRVLKKVNFCSSTESLPHRNRRLFRALSKNPNAFRVPLRHEMGEGRGEVVLREQGTKFLQKHGP
jgi:hypothetical protein